MSQYTWGEIEYCLNVLRATNVARNPQMGVLRDSEPPLAGDTGFLGWSPQRWKILYCFDKK